MSTLRVLHLVGSPTDELYADLSRLYARDCLVNTADADRYEPMMAHVEPGGSWRFPADLSNAAIAAAEPMPLASALARLSDVDIDVALPQMFCRAGMTTYRSLLDALAVPFVGNTAGVMALGADKALTRAVVSAGGVDIPRGELVRRGDRPTLPPPVVVKPVDADNSLGVTLVREAGDYPAAVSDALEHSAAVLVEQYVELGREVRCGVLERDGDLVCLPLEEYNVDPDDKPVRDAGDKISRDADGELGLVAKDATRAWIVDPSDPVTPAVWAAARRCYRALGCRDYGLFDFRIDPDGRPWFLEAGLYCSFARQSVIAVMAAAAGIALPELLASGITAAIERNRG